MKKTKQFQILSITIMCALVLCLAVAYAALSETLTIRGSASVQAADWDIHFANNSTETTGAAKISVPTFNATSISGLNVTLAKPGDSATLKFDIVNEGDVNASLETLDEDELTCKGSATEPDGQAEKDAQLVCGNITYEFKYQDTDEPVKLKDRLDSKQTRSVYLKITYKSTANDLPTDAVNITGLDKTLIYNQSITRMTP